MIKHFKNSNWGQIFKMLFLTLGVVGFSVLIICNTNPSFLWHTDSISLSLIVPGTFRHVRAPSRAPGRVLSSILCALLDNYGIGVTSYGWISWVCDIWFVEISNINPRNVIKNSSADHLLQETCYYTNDWFHKLYKAVWQKNLELKQR